MRWKAFEYDIASAAGNLLAKKQNFSFAHKLEIFSGESAVARIHAEPSFLHSRYRFILQDGREYNFAREKVWTPIYACTGNGETYSVTRHGHSSLSVFKNDHPIATIERPFSFWKNTEYKISMEGNADLLVVACMVLTIRTIEQESEAPIIAR